MTDPHLKDGYARIANEILEALARIRISGEEMQCLWVILRQTYGWNKKEDKISFTQFAAKTGLSKPSVSRALKKLLTKKIIAINKKDNSNINIYRFNKHLGEWQPLTKKIIPPQALTILSKSIDKNVKESIDKNVTHKRQYKNTNKRHSNSKFIKPTLNEVKEYCKTRLNNINPQAFLDFYESKNWMIGKNKMKNWKAAVHTWEHKNKLEDKTSWQYE
jgi:phage replication O-like protein O